MSLINARVYCRIDGVTAPWVTDRLVSYKLADRSVSGKGKKKSKRDEATLMLADPERDLESLLQVDASWEICFGWPGKISRPRHLRLKETSPEWSEQFPVVELKFQATGGAKLSTEPHRTRVPRRWGAVSSSEVAARIATRHSLRLAIEDSDDADEPIAQAADESDYALLGRLADDLGWEFFIDNDVLYFRAPPELEAPRGTLAYLPRPGVEGEGLISFKPTFKAVAARTRALSAGTSRPDPPTTASGEADAPTDDPIATAKLKVGYATTAAALSQRAYLADPENVELAIEAVSSKQTLAEARDEFTAALASRRVEVKTKGKKAWASTGAPPPTVSQKTCKDGAGAGATTDVGASPEPGGYLELGLSGDRSFRVVPEAEAEAVVATPASSRRARERKACASQRERINRTREATATVIGDPTIQAKVNYVIRGVGKASGQWYVTEADHTVSADGMHMAELKLRRGRAPEKKPKGKPGSSDTSGDAPQTMLVLDVSGSRSFSFETTRVPSP